MPRIVTDQIASSVGFSVCQSCEPYKMAEPIEMPFGLWAQVAQETMQWGPHPPREGAIFGRGKAAHYKV